MPTVTGSSMRRVSPWLQLLTLFGLFGAGGFIGLFLASWAAPASGLAAGISGMLLPAAFAAGLIVWGGLDIVLTVLRGRRGRDSGRRLAGRTGIWFVPLSMLFSSMGGLFVGLLPGGQGVLLSTLAYAGAGSLYGWLAARLAALGYLPRPNEG